MAGRCGRWEEARESGLAGRQAGRNPEAQETIKH